MFEVKLVEALHQGNLELDCPNMVLTGQDGEEANVYIGPGTISQNSDGQLVLKLFSQKPFKSLMPFKIDVEPGEVVPDAAYYSLEATDYRGRPWKASHILPRTECLVSGQPMIVTGDLRSVFFSEKLPGELVGTTLRATYFNDLEYPCNVITHTKSEVDGEERSICSSLDRAKFHLGQWNVEIARENDIPYLRCDLQGQHNPVLLLHKVTQSLQFAFSKAFHLASTETCCGSEGIYELRSRPLGDDKGRLNPPIRYHRVLGAEPIYRLMDCYFRFLEDGPEHRWHPLSEYAYSIIESSAASLEATALATCVAVEGASRIALGDPGEPDENFKKAIVLVKEFVAEAEIGKEHKKRLSGALGSMNRPRAVDMLGALVSLGKVKESHVQAWERLRNKCAHASDLSRMSPQEKMDLITTVVGLFNCLVFCAVGYEGPFVDYSQRGWPEGTYPNSIIAANKESS